MKNVPWPLVFLPDLFSAECLSRLSWSSLARVWGCVCNGNPLAALAGPRAFVRTALSLFCLWPGSHMAVEVANVMEMVCGPSVNISI